MRYYNKMCNTIYTYIVYDDTMQYCNLDLNSCHHLFWDF